MNILILYDTAFGNTGQVAQAIGSALEDRGSVRVLKVSEASLADLQGVDVLIAGSPTQAFQPLKGLTAFLKSIPPGGLKGMRAAAFDTRVDVQAVGSGFLTLMVKLFGYAAEPISRMLKSKGAEILLQPEGFFVLDKEGPLKDGE
ncbi:MAG TPA: flavodoxin domain-containing protein, partial [Anaerolineaceae bacterium]|nr:flavodoxin domain-containing protein [Anaerolineaceae bacterium]